jgi:hypothetical protein
LLLPLGLFLLGLIPIALVRPVTKRVQASEIP